MATLTFNFEQDLPKVPLPNLADTLDRLLIILKPYTTPKEFRDLENEIKNLKNRDSKQGQNLVLLQRALESKHKSEDHYFIDWWNETYLESREALIPCESMIPHYPYLGSQVEAASKLVFATTYIFQRLRKELVQPRLAYGKRLSMQQYRHLFQSYRRPGENIDELITKFKTEKELGEGANPALGHILVGCNSQFYRLDLSVKEHNDQFRALTLEEIRDSLEFIKMDASKISLSSNMQVGALTAAPRDMWSGARRIMASFKANQQAIRIVEDAAFAVLLDDTSPSTAEVRLKESAIGTNIGTRWFDIGMQFVVFANSKISYIMEHSSLDALPTFWLQEELYSLLSELKDMQIPKSSKEDAPVPMKLHWQIPESVQAYIESAHKVRDRIWENWEVRIKRLQGFGSKIIKQLSLSPDSFVQFCLQIAYFRLYQHIPAVYESVVTTRFRKSRTEDGRPVTNEIVELVSIFSKKYTSILNIEKKKVKEAIVSHSRRISLARQGQGVDRHLFALRQIAAERKVPLPQVLQANNPIFQRASCSDLSTSHVTSPRCALKKEHGTAFHPVSIDSIGVVYGVYPSFIDFTIMTDRRSTKTNGTEFVTEVFKAFYDVLSLLLPSETSKL